MIPNGTVTMISGTIQVTNPPHITVVKRADNALVLRRRAELLQSVEYMETQIGRLASMARDIRAEILLLTIE